MDEITLAQMPEERRMTAVFLGKDRHRRVAGSSNSLGSYTAMADCLNMTSEEYPCAMVREKRLSIVNQYVTDDLTYKDIKYTPARVVDSAFTGSKLAYLLSDGTIMCGRRVWDREGDAQPDGRLYPFGHGLFIPSYNVYIPDVMNDDTITVDAVLSAEFDVSFSDEEGNGFQSSAAAPANPSEGDYWYKTGENHGLYRYEYGEWVSWPVYYTKLTPAAQNDALILTQIHIGDVIRINDEDNEPYIGYVTVNNVVSDGTAVSVILETMHDPETGVNLIVERKSPRLDHVVVHNNRVWGCRYGYDADNKFVNEIYACKLGDPTNWYANYLSADGAFTTGVGDEGKFTGAAVVGDHVVFFKEHCFYTVYGDSPEDFRVQVTYADGIMAGSDRSAVNINGALYYLSPHGVMRLYSGTLPQRISDDLMYKCDVIEGVAGTDGRKYLLNAVNFVKEQSQLYVYDTELNEWHIEDGCGATCMVQLGNELLAVSSEPVIVGGQTLYEVHLVYLSPPGAQTLQYDRYTYLCFYDDVEQTVVYPNMTDYYPGQYGNHVNANHWIDEDTFEWSFETGDFGHEATDYKRVKSIAVRAWMETGATMEIKIQYDEDGKWVELDRSVTIPEGATGTTRVEYRLRRCDLYRLRFSGTGRVCIYSITHVYEGDGDRSYGNPV